MERRPQERVLAAVLFLDIVGSTEVATELGDERWQELLRRYRGVVRAQLRRFRGREVDTAGDGFFATFARPADGVHAAGAIVEAVRELGIEVRAGLHFGECEVRGPELAGIAVHTGARVMSLAGPGEVLVTATVRDLVAGAQLQFEGWGMHTLKGVPGEWRLYALVSTDRPEAWPSARRRDRLRATRRHRARSCPRARSPT
jgi:class 3 adenylate cyclase